MKHLFFSVLLFCGVSSQSQVNPDTIIIAELLENVWNYEAWTSSGKYYFPSDGLLLKTDSGLVIIDTPVTDSLTEVLLSEFKGEKIALAIITHFHNDRMGGIRTLLKYGINVICFAKTAELAIEDGYPKATGTFVSSDTGLTIGKTYLELYYPGWGHTIDNILVWIPDKKILYGGCFIKENKSETLGNTKEANLSEWLSATKRVKKKFSRAKIVIPGHGDIGNAALLRHTIRLLKRQVE